MPNNDPTIRPVDTLKRAKKPCRRHRAIVNKVRAPYPDRTYDSEIAVTVCGKMLARFNDARQVSLLNTEGGVYAVECDTCFGTN